MEVRKMEKKYEQNSLEPIIKQYEIGKVPAKIKHLLEKGTQYEKERPHELSSGPSYIDITD